MNPLPKSQLGRWTIPIKGWKVRAQIYYSLRVSSKNGPQSEGTTLIIRKPQIEDSGPFQPRQATFTLGNGNTPTRASCCIVLFPFLRAPSPVWPRHFLGKASQSKARPLQNLQKAYVKKDQELQKKKQGKRMQTGKHHSNRVQRPRCIRHVTLAVSKLDPLKASRRAEESKTRVFAGEDPKKPLKKTAMGSKTM